MRHLFLFLGLAISASGLACTGDSIQDPKECGVMPNLSVDATATPQNSDGGVQIIGRTAYAPAAAENGGAGTGTSSAGPSERAVYDLYVGGERVTQTVFNFRAWTVNISRAEVCAYATTDASTKQLKAQLPVRVYLTGPNGVCVFDLPASVSVPLAAHTCDSAFDGGSGGS